jgi:molybdenum cofactor cytidylyltransferase
LQLHPTANPIAVVLGAKAERIKPEISQLPIQIVENKQWERE